MSENADIDDDNSIDGGGGGVTNVLSELKKKGKNLKIVIENDNATTAAAAAAAASDELFDYEELKGDEVTGDVSKMELDVVMVGATGGDGDGDDDEDGPEFHVNLNKAPPTLQNTILNEKIYLNEAKDAAVNVEKNVDVVTEESLKLLYESLGVDEESFMPMTEVVSTSSTNDDFFRSTGIYKKNSLYIFGVDELNTNEVFEFFKGYKPFAIEWINDSSCNVLWKNVNHCLNAIIDLSEPYKSDVDVAADRKERLPPRGCIWRVFFKRAEKTGNRLYVRFTRRTDRKQKGAESRSQYYVKYGNPNYGNMTGLISNSRRRKMKHMQISAATSDLTLDDNDDRDKGDDETATETENLKRPVVKYLDDEDDKTSDLTGRKLISYNIENSAFRQKDDLEEFGTGTSSASSGTHKIDYELAKKKPLYKSKKMHLYSDEIGGSGGSGGGGGKKRSYDNDYESGEDEEVDDDDNGHRRGYDNNNFHSNKRFNRYEPYNNRFYARGGSSGGGYSRGPPAPNDDLRYKLNKMNYRRPN